MKQKIAVLLSGGVDSSTVLGMLAAEGRYDLTAFYLKIWLEDDLAFLGDCPWEEDLEYARAVCEKYSVPLRVISLQSEYHRLVVDYALQELKAGRTPSPDIFCNQRIKFGSFLDKVGHEFDLVASGHYASKDRDQAGNAILLRGVDPIKDQTYFLSHLSQAQLQKCLFPLGGLQKSEVRAVAKELGIPAQSRPESQGICFLGKISYRDFVASHLGEKPGQIREKHSERVLGQHRGFWFHTIGQRKGLGLSGGPWFVSGKDVVNNVIYVSHADSASACARDSFSVGPIHWIAAKPDRGLPLSVKVRHGPNTYRCELEVLANDEGLVNLSSPDAGLAVGQFAVFYQDQVCLGGAMISG